MTDPNCQLNQQIDEMRQRLAANAQNEQALLRALSDALGEADTQLLNEVRHVTAEHEARRNGILNELQTLASRLCVFPKPLTAEHINGHARPRDQVTVLKSETPAAGSRPARHAPGDWRMAASNIDEELDFYLDARPVSN